MVQVTPWAVLACQFNDSDARPFSLAQLQGFFTASGSGTMNMVDFFRDNSHGNVDISGTQVFGWLTIDRPRSDYTGSGANQAGRAALLNWGRDAATKAGVSLGQFFNVVVVTNVPTDLFGGGAGVVTSGIDGSLLAQEMGHGYLLNHSRASGSQQDYMDPYDTMSTAAAFMTPHRLWNNVGPGLNAANMRYAGWLEESRVWKSSSRRYNAVVQLRPLHRADLPGLLAAQVGDILVEFRMRDRWDANIPWPCVLLHRLENGQSYLISANNGARELVTGAYYEVGTPNTIWDPWTRIQVLAIDANAQVATVQISFQARHQPYAVGPARLFAGVASDGGGYVIVGGKLVPIPPRSPLLTMLEQIAVLQAADDIGMAPVRQAVRQHVLTRLAGAAQEELRTTTGFRSPALPAFRRLGRM